MRAALPFLFFAIALPATARAQQPAAGRGVGEPGGVEGRLSRDSVAALLTLRRPPELEPFGRLAPLRLPAGAVAWRLADSLRLRLVAREARLVSAWLGVRDPRSAPSRLTFARSPIGRPVVTDSAAATPPMLERVADYADLALRLNARLETQAEQAKTDPCLSVVLASGVDRCRTSFTPSFNFQFNVQSGGVVADRVHVDVDYDSEREFDASNNLSIYYQGKENELLQRLEVGNVSFAPPPSRFITAGIPSGNYGLQAIGQVGPMRFRAIAAQQKGKIVRDARFTVGDRTERNVDRDIEDYQVEPRRFFFTVDPARFPRYPNIDILDRAQMQQIAASLGDTVRPSRVRVYRLQIGSQPANPSGPRFIVQGLPSGNRAELPYELLRENVDYYIDQSLLWFALVRPTSLDRDRLVVAYNVNIGGRDTVIVATGGTPDVEFVAGKTQVANLVYDPSVRPGDPAFRREIRSVYRIGGDEVRRNTVTARIVAGAGGDQEKPSGAGAAETYLQMFRLAQPTNAAAFDAENRVWPRPSDPNVSLGAGGGTSRTIRDYFVVLPSLQPFSRAGLVAPDNPANDTIYTTPSEYLYSQQHPPSVYRIRLRYQAEGSGDPGSLMLGAVQLRRNSERIVLDGVPLARGTDYTVDYELGRVLFSRPDTLFPRPRQITVQYEENPLFAQAPTNIFALAATFPAPQGELTFTVLSQTQKSLYNRPELGFEPASSLVAGVSGNWAFDASLLTNALARLPFSDRPGASRVALQAELATSRPQPNSAGRAYLESFEGEGGVGLSTLDVAWFLASRPTDTPATDTITGISRFADDRAASLVWQTNVSNGGRYTPSRIDPLIRLVGQGIEPLEPLLWMTLQPLGTGFVRERDNGGATRWLTGTAPPGARRWRSIRTVISPSGTDLTRAEEIEFWALVDTRGTTRDRNPTLVVDLGDISENTLAFTPDSLVVVGSGDSTFYGKRKTRIDTLDTERDSVTRSFNAAQNDRGIAPDVARSLQVITSGQRVAAENVPLCSGENNRAFRLGDQRANCTVRNNRLDEEDIDLDYLLNYDEASAPLEERYRRFVVDLSDPRSETRRGRCYDSLADTVGSSTSAFCWVLVRLPLNAPTDTKGTPELRRVKALRLTMIAGRGVPDGEALTTPIARLRLAGPPWLKRAEVPLDGIGGDATVLPAAGYVTASLIRTSDAGYQSPPGVREEQRDKASAQGQRIEEVNESSLRIRAGDIPRYGRAEAFYRFPEGAKGFLGYRELRVWARAGNPAGFGDNGELEMFVRIGRDIDNFYLYHAPAYAGQTAAAWRDVRVDFRMLQRLRARIQNTYLRGGKRIDCTGDDSVLVARSKRPLTVDTGGVYAACEEGYIAYTASPAVTPPNLAAVQELSVGMVRLRAGTGPDPITVADTLELWIDDIRLRDVVDTPGYAGQLALELNAGGIADLRLVASRRDPYFRQLAEQPSFTGDAGLDLASTVRLEKLLPAALGVALPLTITHSGGSSQPELLSRSDLEAEAVDGLRTPRTSATAYALSARRVTPMSNAMLGMLLDNVQLNGTWATSNARSEYQDGGARSWNVGMDYLVSAAPRATALPAWVTRAIGVLPPWLAESDLGRAIRGASLRWNPAAVRFTSALARTNDERRTFVKPAAALDDAPRRVEAESHVWRNGAAIELRPAGPLSLRWDAVSLRDLRHYRDSGEATRSRNAAAARERGSLLGADVGLERERQMSAAMTFAPPLAIWLRPRLDLGSTFTYIRDPNARALAPVGLSGDSALPRRFGNTQSLSASAQLDLQRAARAYWQTSQIVRYIGDRFAPIEVAWNRSLLSAFDDEAFTPSLGYQFALGGAGNFRRLADRAATTAGLTNALAANSALALPLDFALISRFGRTTTRSWYRRSEERQDVVDGLQLDFPDLTLRWTAVPAKGAIGSLAGRVVRNLATNVGMRHTRVSSLAPSTAGAADERVSRVRVYPASATVSWAFGDLSSTVGYSWTVRDDTLPGSASHGTTGEKSADVLRSFALPAQWSTRSPLRTRMSYQETRTRNVLALSGRRLADNGRRAFSLSADTDVNETMTFSLQGSRTATVDRNYNRRYSQTVITAALQLQFFSGELK